MADAAPRKKLIEVALPLEAINTASAREKSIKHGHPSTLHLWWSRKPLATCRAVLFAQLVDDPSSLPEEFPTKKAQEQERQRLFRIIEDLVKWENSNDKHVIARARREIARSVARARGDAPPAESEVDSYLAARAPPILDPFCGGGSIPLEAQRLGLRAHGSDLNPVATLITKALIEIPPQFAELPPVNPQAQKQLIDSASWQGTEGLADDIRYYGRWMRDEAKKRIGHFYPKARLPDGTEAKVIAWLWARTVASPDPVAKGAHVPLVSSFTLLAKKGKEAWAEPVINYSTKTYRFKVRYGSTSPRAGTMIRKQGGRCLLTGASMPFDYIRAEGKAGRLSERLMAVVVEGKHGRLCIDPTDDMEELARRAKPTWKPEGKPRKLKYSPVSYGMSNFAELFTDRQLAALTTLSDLVAEAREKILSDAQKIQLPDDSAAPAKDRVNAHAYADAIATYLGLCVGRQANRSSNINFWDPYRETVQQVFARQAVSMIWSFCEGNPFSDSSGNFIGQVGYLAKVIEASPKSAQSGLATQASAMKGNASTQLPYIVSTDPPYYDNIIYADLSDFFYVWLRHALAPIHPDLFTTLLTPKTEELVVAPYRFEGSKEKARDFFENGFRKAMSRLRLDQESNYPLTLYYAYKQAETKRDAHGEEVMASTGWEAMLTGVIEAGFMICGTWPMRTELISTLKKREAALASSIVLVCRPRPENAPQTTSAQFRRELEEELPKALRLLQQGNVAPVDFAQAAIGPGMAIYSRYRHILKLQGGEMSVRAALYAINQILAETLSQVEDDFDSDTRWAMAWFEQHSFREGAFGVAETLSKAKAVSIDHLQQNGILDSKGGRVCLLSPDRLEREWDPQKDKEKGLLSTWKIAHQILRLYYVDQAGDKATARLLDKVGKQHEPAIKDLAYRLYNICERKKWAREAQSYNALAQGLPEAVKLADSLQDKLFEKGVDHDL